MQLLQVLQASFQNPENEPNYAIKVVNRKTQEINVGPALRVFGRVAEINRKNRRNDDERVNRVGPVVHTPGVQDAGRVFGH